MYQNNAKTHYNTMEQMVRNFFFRLFGFSIVSMIVCYTIVITNHMSDNPSESALSMFGFLGKSSLRLFLIVLPFIIWILFVQFQRAKMIEKQLEQATEDFKNSI